MRMVAGHCCDLGQELGAVHAGHAHVGDDQVDVGAGQDIEPGLGAGGGEQAVALRPEGALQGRQDALFIIHQQHAGRRQGERIGLLQGLEFLALDGGHDASPGSSDAVLGGLGAGGIDGQFDPEGGASARFTADMDVAAMLLDDAVGQRQSQPGPAADRLGGEEGFEDAVDVFRRDAVSGIADADGHALAAAFGADGDALVLDGLGRIDQQVHEDLVQFRGQALDHGQLAVLLDDGDLVLQFVVGDVEGTVQAAMQVGHLPVAFAGAREILQRLHDVLDRCKPSLDSPAVR
jgi:hypothetical protein